MSVSHEIITRNESDVKIDVICVESGGLQLVIANAFFLLSAQMPLLGLNVNQGPYNDIRELNILHFYDNSFWLLYLLFRAPTCERN